MDDPDRMWQEAAALVQGDADADLRLEARELYQAEATRCRLLDRQGPVRVVLRCGLVLAGELAPHEAVAGCLALAERPGRLVLLPVEALVLLEGSASALRDESAAREVTLGSWLREAWSDGEALSALDAAGTWHTGPVAFVGADHVAIAARRPLDARPGTVVLPWSSVQAWAR